MKQQPHTDNPRNPDRHKKVVTHERENGRAKGSEKKSDRNPNRQRSNRVEHDGSDHVL